MPVKKSKQTSSKRVGSPGHKLKVKSTPKKQTRKREDKGIMRDGDYFAAKYWHGDMSHTYNTVGQVRRNKKGVYALLNNEIGSRTPREFGIDDLSNFESALVLAAPTEESLHKSRITDFKVVTDAAAIKAIEQRKTVAVMGYEVRPTKGNREFSVGCGSVFFARETLETLLKIRKLIPAQQLEDYGIFVRDVVNQGHEIGEVKSQDVEALLKYFPVKKRSTKSKKPKR